MGDSIPVTYVPARNTIFLSFALAWAEVLGAQDIFIGVNALDYSGYPDCRPEYVEAYQRMANLAVKAAVEGTFELTVHTPLIAMSKADIIRRGMELGVDYGMTSSCYDPDEEGTPCGACDSCQLQLMGFQEAGAVDPLHYHEFLRRAIAVAVNAPRRRSGWPAVGSRTRDGRAGTGQRWLRSPSCRRCPPR